MCKGLSLLLVGKDVPATEMIRLPKIGFLAKPHYQQTWNEILCETADNFEFAREGGSVSGGADIAGFAAGGATGSGGFRGMASIQKAQGRDVLSRVCTHVHPPLM